ncbi:hypothetical protein ACFRK4_24550, partial [Peribacillus butanolivorans]|uniref:hypothetical protein n=1 Tax=Peribacillus butanolivorans TaxID=421767 RepID=UPI0036710683
MYDEGFQYVYVSIKVSIIDKCFIINDLFFIKQKRSARMADLFKMAWRRPTLTGGNPQLPSALKSLTAV